MKWTALKALLLLVTSVVISTGCNSSAVNDAGQAEKQKEQAGIDKRADAIDKLSGSSASGSN